MAILDGVMNWFVGGERPSDSVRYNGRGGTATTTRSPIPMPGRKTNATRGTSDGQTEDLSRLAEAGRPGTHQADDPGDPPRPRTTRDHLARWADARLLVR